MSLTSTDRFKQVIKNKLKDIAEEDKLFAETLKKPNKNIEDCIKYILNQVKRSGICGFEDQEIFGMAIHYYDEEDIEVGGNVACEIVTNHYLELTAEEKQEAKKKAFNEELERQRAKLTKKAKSKKTKEPKVLTSNTLF